jgi:hypothetical protein
MTINVSEALDSDTGEIVTVVRTVPGAYIDGIYSKGVESTFKTLASVQQPSAEQLDQLEEGERNRDARLFISKKPLRGMSDRDGTIADLVIYRGFRYKIIAPKDWSVYGHTTVMGVREQ